MKKKCIELIYSWSKGLPHETKILEAYKMLKQQGIVKEDPDYIDKVGDVICVDIFVACNFDIGEACFETKLKLHLIAFMNMLLDFP